MQKVQSLNVQPAGAGKRLSGLIETVRGAGRALNTEIE